MSEPSAHAFVVTGASGGLGQAIVHTLARRAAEQHEQRHIILVGRNRRLLESASAQEVNTFTRTYLLPDIDLSQPADSVTAPVIAKLRAVAEPLASPRLTLIHCAGTLGDLAKTIGQYGEQETTEYIATNLTSYCALTSRFLDYAQGTGASRICVVNISSLLAVRAFPNWGLYAAIKAARDQLLCVVAEESKNDARVRTLSYAPGPLDNSMQQMVRQTLGDSEQRQLYAQMHQDGKLVNLDTTAGLLCDLLGKLRRRQVEVLTRALGQFVTLKSTAEGWQPVQPLPLHSESVSGGDISVHLGRKPITVNGKTSDIYRMTASIPLDADVSRDTQGQFSAYLSELRDWQAVLESPGIRNLWNYFVGASTTLEMLDAHTRITRSQMRSPVPGQAAEFAHSRDLLMVETSLVDPTTVVYVATSFPTTDDDPAYMRQQPNIKRVESDLWAWCVELGTPADAISLSTQQQNQRTAELNAVRKPRACVQVTCFMHLELKSWKSNNALACRAATNLIPALVAYLRLHGAPPRLARIGPAISLERTEWRRTPDAETAWEAVYSVATRNQRTADSAAINQPILSRILDLETSSTSPPTQPPPLSHHTRRVSSLTTYLSSSFERQQGEASALGTHAGGILRDGEEEAVVATRARLSGSILELVIDASKWHSDKRSADISIAVRGFRSARQLFQSIKEMHSAAPELFTSTQLELTWDSFKLTQDQAAAGSDARRNSLALSSSARRAQEADRKMVANLTAAQLVRCFAIRSQKSSRRRYLVRVLNPPIMASAADYAASDGESSTADSTFVADNSDESTADRVYGVSIAVCRGA
ncbi:hypothetical protein H4S01_005201, partial [Coemansia sp. RSA 2610]